MSRSKFCYACVGLAPERNPTAVAEVRLEFIRAARVGLTDDVEEMLHRPLDPNLPGPERHFAGISIAGACQVDRLFLHNPFPSCWKESRAP